MGWLEDKGDQVGREWSRSLWDLKRRHRNSAPWILRIVVLDGGKVDRVMISNSTEGEAQAKVGW
jgi:hypothetical protein